MHTRKLLGTWRHGQATTDEYPIQLELSEKPSFSGSGAQEAPNEEKSVSASSDVTASQLNGENILLGEISLQTFRIRITETPLTAHNLGTIVSTLAELSTKCWLIRQGRFAELMEYTQTHDSRFAEEVPVVITKVTFNIPVVIAFGTLWFSSTQSWAGAAASEQQHKTDLQIAQQQYQNNITTAKDQQQETALQNYLDLVLLWLLS